LVNDEPSVPGRDKCHFPDKRWDLGSGGGKKKKKKVARSFPGTPLIVDEPYVEDASSWGRRQKTEDRGEDSLSLHHDERRITIDSRRVPSDFIINFKQVSMRRARDDAAPSLRR